MVENRKNLIPIAIIIAGLLIAGAFVYVNQGKVSEKAPEGLSPQQAAEKAIAFINENMLQERATASLVSIVEESGIYKIQLKIEDQEFPSYVTKDGKLLFPQEGINLDEEIPASEEPAGTTAPPEKEYSEEKLEALAKCLSEKGAKFYGTYTCPYCMRQKEMFGEAAEYLPYIECSSDRATEAEIIQCREANVGSIPDWRFPDGTQKLGLQSVEQLAELSGCPL